MFRCIGKQSAESVLKKKGRLQREGFAEKECFVLRLGKKERGLMEY